MLKSPQTAIAQRPKADTTLSAELSPFEGGDKKQLKRAANRRSAQLSRKRKKQFIEELMEENDELRRKEQILVSIPDLIVVFDSSGKLWFVSHSVSRFLDFSPRELEGSWFWDRLCDDSVRLLKAAFMDALAARKTDTDTTPLGSGVWVFRLVDKDGSQKVITLNGVVHFTGESPECVCSIRPREERVESAAALPTHRNVSITSGSSNGMQLIRPTIKPQQSVISSLSSDDASRIARVKAPRRRSAQISDVGSICSESGSDS
jgi:PAS domain S-box-containing protein